MHRFLSQNTDLNTKTLTITDSKEIHHLSTVLRLKKGSEIAIFNGKGEEVFAKVEALTPQSVQLSIVSAVKESSANTVTVTLACAIPKKAKFETIIEKCTELGVDRIIPVMTERTEVRLSPGGERADKKQKRYETVAVNAAKQSQRSILPTVDAPTAFKDVLKQLSPADAAFIPCLNGERRNLLEAFHVKPGQTNTIFFIGPEGDFTPKELKDALAAGCIPVTLGPHVLKVDTAAIATVAAAKLLIERDRL
ncbi:MAG: 16S rRNA (uracil(1498)-N(3))-methyltransferase [Candidatus Omnitrophica bacterium]|nr:16S rRNA (uracil(1498)-N(3))-methyltransferase [Candidatus Omnitrophota bacterium]